MEREIDDLRAWHYLPHSPGKTRVFPISKGTFPYENRLTLLVGSADGVGIGMPVESPRGLVGTVQTVEPRRCQVALLASAGLKIGAVDGSRNPSPAGLLSGESSSKLTLVFEDPEAPVSLGDQILTSGFSDRIPAGIPIGRVIAVDYNPEFGTRRATVFPAVQVGELREVAVLK